MTIMIASSIIRNTVPLTTTCGCACRVVTTRVPLPSVRSGVFSLVFCAYVLAPYNFLGKHFLQRINPRPILSGPKAHQDGLGPSCFLVLTWFRDCTLIDNDPEHGGGKSDDLLSQAVSDNLLSEECRQASSYAFSPPPLLLRVALSLHCSILHAKGRQARRADTAESIGDHWLHMPLPSAPG